MKKTLSLILAMLMLFSVFTVSSFAALAPEISEITSTFEGVSISWDKSADATTYLVYRDGICIGTTVECTFVDTAVTENKTYVYTVGAQAKDGTTEISSASFDVTYIRPYCAHSNYEYVVDYPATVFKAGLKHKHCKDCGKNEAGEAIPQLVPESPVIKSVSNSTKGLKVTWNLVDGATAYRVYRRAGGESSYKRIATVKGASYEDTTVSSGKTYKYVIRAVNAGGLSKYIGGKARRFVATPSDLAAKNTTAGIRFTWAPVENATGYRVYRKVLGDTSWTYLKTVKTTYYPDLKVDPGVDYIYTVRAVSGKIYSGFYPGVQIKRLEVAQLNEAKSTAEGIYVDFEPVEGADGYYVYRKVGNSKWSLLGTIRNTRSHTYLDVSAQKGVKYTYTVRAYSKDGAVKSVGYYVTKGISCKDVY